MAWKPLIEGAPAEHVRRVIAKIVEDLSAPETMLRHVEQDPAGLARGASGFALFHGYHHLVTGIEEAAQRRDEALAASFDIVSEAALPPSLWGGFLGVAWTVNHFGNPNDDDSLGESDDALLSLLETDPGRYGFELLGGVAGWGLYALARLPRPRAAACVEAIVTHLERSVDLRGDGAVWSAPPELLSDSARRLGGIDLSVAHGVPGVIGFLAQAATAGIAADPARSLLDRAVTWLLRQRQGNGWFPARIDQTGAPVGGRIAWCIGGAGIAAVLWLAARCMENAVWADEAVAIARTAASVPPETTGVGEPGFCHGSAGLAHIYNRLYQATDDASLGAAARYWLARTLDWRKEGTGIGGYVFRGTSDRQSSDLIPGVLMGSAGVGLVLLAATTSVEPRWDQLFLLSAVG